MAEDAWNTRDPPRVAQAYTPDSVWKNRAAFLVGREATVLFLIRKWNRELEYCTVAPGRRHFSGRLAFWL